MPSLVAMLLLDFGQCGHGMEMAMQDTEDARKKGFHTIQGIPHQGQGRLFGQMAIVDQLADDKSYLAVIQIHFEMPHRHMPIYPGQILHHLQSVGFRDFVGKIKKDGNFPGIRVGFDHETDASAFQSDLTLQDVIPGPFLDTAIAMLGQEILNQ